jgi:hypothetical protein
VDGLRLEFRVLLLGSDATGTSSKSIGGGLDRIGPKNGLAQGKHPIFSGHLKGYTIKLNPLDGVYCCDIRPNMQTDPLLRSHIQTIDHLFCTALWSFLD